MTGHLLGAAPDDDPREVSLDVEAGKLERSGRSLHRLARVQARRARDAGRGGRLRRRGTEVGRDRRERREHKRLRLVGRSEADKEVKRPCVPSADTT